TVTNQLRIGQGLCQGGVSALGNAIQRKLKETLLRKIGNRVPGFTNAYRRAHYQRDKLDWFYQRVYDAISYLVNRVADVVNAQGLVNWVAENFCSFLVGDDDTPFDNRLEFDPAQVVVTASCGTISGGTYTCQEACADENVLITARANFCGKNVIGQTRVLCLGCRSTCESGCCDGQTCLATQDQDETMCGASGAVCMACSGQDECEDGVCTCQSTCTQEQAEEGATQCGSEGEVSETCQEVEDGCYRWIGRDCSESGATCDSEEGVCTGGCGAWNCDGCCSAEHLCTDSESVSTSACGAGGSLCQACIDGEECVGGSCVCRSPECEFVPNFSGGGNSAGDPHISTLDSLHYDFQGAGEFILVESTGESSDFVVQIRQEPWTLGSCDGVAVNTAVAMRVEGTVVAYYLGDESISIDGESTTVEVGDPA
ncbi:MAG: hypothetical protein KC561_19620, partial [Myxococcales bacterium]|nr:hypothetical protein [Myxococcales bacterium]